MRRRGGLDYGDANGKPASGRGRSGKEELSKMRVPKRNQAGPVPMFHTSVATGSNRSRNLHLEILNNWGQVSK